VAASSNSPLIPAKAGIQCWVPACAGTSGIIFSIVVVLAGAPAAPAEQQRVVNFYNWSDYIDPTVLDDFSRTTGIKVRYDTFDSNDTLEAKLLAGKSGYDVVVPTGYFLTRQISASIFQKLDKAKLPNLVNAWPEIAERLATYDPGNQYAVNYMWGTTGIGYNVKAARDILGGGDDLLDSWDDVFDPEKIARFKDCGVHLLDSSDDIMPAALHYLHLDPNSSEPADLQKAADLLARIRPYVRKFHSSEYLNALASGEGQERHRDRLCYPQGRRAIVVRQFRHPPRCARRRRSARADRLSAQARGGGEKLKFHFLRQRQSGEPEIHRPLDPRRPHHLSRRRDHG
jgi:spermidine/putrescine-binding protein